MLLETRIQPLIQQAPVVFIAQPGLGLLQCVERGEAVLRADCNWPIAAPDQDKVRQQAGRAPVAAGQAGLFSVRWR